MTAEASEAETDLRIERQHAACQIILDRPSVLNALSIEMKAQLAAAMPGLVRDPEIYALIYKSALPGAFCVGGDVKELAALATSDPTAARKSLADEYRLNWLLECFFKPSIALINGAVMGSGVGLTQYGTHIVAAENYRFAMPETAIGFFPDVGMAWKLAQLPNFIGFYLGLSGRAIGRADAYALGLVSHCIGSSEFEAIESALADSQPIDPVVDGRQTDPGEGELKAYLPTIARAFSRPTLEEIMGELAAIAASASDDHKAWCEQLSQELREKSPVALKVSLRHLQKSAHRDLRQTLIADYHLACRFLENRDFHEGVRAMLIAKSKDPVWQHSALEDISAAHVESYFTIGDEAKFELPTKEEMEFN